jgi:hypothetical protein
MRLRRTTTLTVSLSALAGLALTLPAGAATSRVAAPTNLRVVGSGLATHLAWKPAAPSDFRVQQATDAGFTLGLKTYKVREPGKAFTPYGLGTGGTYYFRVRALVDGKYSKYSNAVSYTATWTTSTVKVLSYNSMSASLDGERHPGGTSKPFSERRANQLYLLNKSNAAVIGIQEAGSCIAKPHGVPCTRQIDSLADGLKPRYTLAERDYTACGKCFNRYTADYILYDPNLVEPVPGTYEDTWNVGPSGKQARYAAYQLFQVVGTRAKFLFISTHILSNRGSNYDQIREQETKSLVSQAEAYANREGVTSIFYAGDFNSYYKEYGLKDLTGTYMRNHGVPDGIDVAQKYVNAKYDSVNELYSRPRKGHGSIDHIYATGGIGVQKWGELLRLKSNGTFVQPIPSDHNPIYMVATIPF